MRVYNSVTQPLGKSNLDLIAEVVEAGSINRIDIAAAYVTTGGARDLLDVLAQGLGVKWPKIEKRWLIAFDYCRTQPEAAQMLKSTTQSSVRIHDGGRVVLRQGCIPTVPFHPKTFIFRGPGRHAVFAGSGNVSRSGLNTGHEVGLLLDWRLPNENADSPMRQRITAVQAWYESVWKAASVLNSPLAKKYAAEFNSVPNLSHPVPTDDDTEASDPPANSLTGKDLLKLRTCSHFWIEAGNITKNLGKLKPGNQLMMKRLSRVFFGLPATNVPQNSPLAIFEIVYRHHSKPDCSLTFSDNGMDKLTLPNPGAGGPVHYDGETLLFKREKAGMFKLMLGSGTQKKAWVRRSDAIDAHYTMTGSGREWGVF